jgi:hypothetical protein
MPRYGFTLAGLLALFVPGHLLPGPAAPPRPRIENLNKLPLAFERNQGQTSSQVKFLAHGQGYTLFLTSGEAVLALHKASAKSGVLRMKLLGADPASDVSGLDEMPAKSNYFIGNDAKKWHTNVPMYAKVKYKSVYSGIDLVYYGNQRQLEYDFVVASGADPRRIQLGVRGARKISRSEDGDLVLAMDAGEIRWHKPVVYQEKGGARQEVAAHYAIKGKNRVAFEVADYDLRRPLFIDPLIYSTYLGGSGTDEGFGVAVDSSGNAYVTGWTGSTNFPTMNPLQPANAGNGDAFVAKLSPAGSALVYSTYLGGSGFELGQGIAVDTSGNAYVTGYTTSTDFPTMNPLQPANGGGADAFVAKLNPTGSALVYSTYLGGSGDDYGSGIAVDNSGNVYVTGNTDSTNFPTMNPFQPDLAGDTNVFVAKLNPTGSALVYSTYLGGSGTDYGNGIAVDSSGNAYVTGTTESTNFPTMNPLQPANATTNGQNAFVAKLDSTGSALIYSTYLGGSSGDEGLAIAADTWGNAYITGYTGPGFPTMNPLQPAFGGGKFGTDAFVTKLNPTGSALVYSTYLGGSENDVGDGIAVDSAGNAYVTGYTQSTDFPTVNPLQPANGGGYSDAFVAELNSTGSALVYSTYLGGTGEDIGWGIAVDGSGNGYVTGITTSTDFPTMNPLQPTYGGSTDAFVVKIIIEPSLAPPDLNFGNQTVGIASASQGSTLNATSAALTVASIDVTGSNSSDFVQTNNCGTSLPVGGSCNITVTFTPSSTGTRTAAVSITDSDPTSPQTLPLSGTGVLPAVTFAPPTGLTFPNQTINTTSPAQNVTLTNTGLGILTVGSIAASGPFAQTNTCGATVNPGASCTLSVTFTPNAIGTLTGSISVTDNAPGSPQALPLSGVGVSPAVTFSPTSLTFPDQTIFMTSAAKNVTLTNTGLGTLTVGSIAASGPFAQTNTCSATVNPGASCTISMTFKPKVKGTLTGSVSVGDNAAGSPQTLPLTGTGTYMKFSPASWAFGTQPVGTHSLPKKIALTNKGSATANIAKISITGADAGDFAQTNTCGQTLASGASCFVTVTFTPTAKGNRTAHVSVVDNGGGSPQTAVLSGAGT